ncbi:uncharacterized protein K444DRAFT_40734 [Hyaloscypha bicolor E]|uniref:Uncharacterized protein n=1 Tax=Hyaloscypha bicolor E TaxID=1095630 RepID=A0A2J6T1S0_9HELO|nr:uncharacterized protein K444DRAFT_40734 [Hyaloscypha bicolor E]PMD56961.1 hypothetical protein K444DRAFT_40734 [Hyaloscypha bicolor E]
MTLAACHINVSSLALPGSAPNHVIKNSSRHMAHVQATTSKINILFSRFLISIAFSFTAGTLSTTTHGLGCTGGTSREYSFRFGAKQRRMGDIEASEMRFSGSVL